jgi:serine/threonine protein kinase
MSAQQRLGFAGSLPARIGRYEIRAELGRGAMGVVYDAFDPSLERSIALKTIELAFLTTPAARATVEKRFIVEAQVAARLSHPGIVMVHDVGQDADTGVIFIALERLPGRTLEEAMKATARMKWRQALQITRRLAEALHHAHSAGIVHRDIKPGNVMLLPTGEPKIMDFGLAHTDTSNLTAAGEVFGTPLYISPEQVRGEKVDGRSDLFSLGAVAYFLLTRRHAFGAENTMRIIDNVMHLEPPPPSAAAPDIPEAVDVIVERALKKDPSLRYPDGQSMAEDIAKLLAEARVVVSATVDGTTTSSPELPPGPDPQEGALSELALLVEDAPPHLSVDLQEELSALAAGSSDRAAPSVSPATSGDPALPSPRIRHSKRLLAVSVLVLASVAAAAVLVNRKAPSSPAASGARAMAEASAAVPPGAATPVDMARMTVDLEHPLKRGTLRVWIDGDLRLQESLGGQVTKKIAGIALRSGSLRKTLDVQPGRHTVKVVIAWDDTAKSETLAGSFHSGDTKELKIRIGRLLKSLSLDWN